MQKAELSCEADSENYLGGSSETICITSDWMFKATTRTFKDDWVFDITVRNGKLTKIREYIDTQALAKASAGGVQ